MPAELHGLRRAIARLGEGVTAAMAEPGNALLRDGVFLRFGSTYDLCCRMIRSVLEATEPSPEVARTASFPALIRLAHARALVSGDAASWHAYREAREIAGRIGDANEMAIAFATILAFLAESQALLAALTIALTTPSPSSRGEAEAIQPTLAGDDGAGRALEPWRPGLGLDRFASLAMTAESVTGAFVTGVDDAQTLDEFGLRLDQRAIVETLLRREAPRPSRIWAFGSRVKGRARRFSDLDLAIDAGRPLTLREEARLSDAFEESILPWRVDVVDLATCSEGFRTEIAGHAVLFLAIPSHDAA